MINLWYFAILLLCAVFFTNSTITFNGTIYFDTRTGNLNFREGIYDDKKGLVFAAFEDSTLDKGWSKLSVKTNPAVLNPTMTWMEKDRTLSFATGLLEGYLTSQKISDHFKNMYNNFWYNFPERKMIKPIRDYFTTQKAWIEQMIEKNKGDYYYEHVANVHQQYLGLVEGYNSAINNKNDRIDYVDFMVMAANGDMDVLIDRYSDNSLYAKAKASNFKINPFHHMKPKEIEAYLRPREHCSSMVKWTKDKSDLLLSHNTWMDYTTMNRIWKEFTINFQNPATGSKFVQFASYPGCISSNDDFFFTDRLYVAETTNALFNLELFKFIQPQSLLVWHRAMIANRMAKDGETWMEVFSKHNSGTYNNQFIIVSLERFVPNATNLTPGLVYILEQMPGTIMTQDVTNFVQEKGFWPSYNVPAIPQIFNISGHLDLIKKDPSAKSFYDYNECFRAKIFRRDAAKIDTLEDMKKFIIYNDYLHDPISEMDPGHSIAARWDLREPEGSGYHICSGATDGKVGRFSDWKAKRRVWLKLGPTNSNGVATFWFEPGYCPPRSSSIHGLPIVYNYDWISTN